MSIYRVTFQTCLLVECDDEVEAEEIGRDFLAEEVGNADLFGIECLSSKDQLEKIEQGSLPWRSWERRNEPDLTVEQILDSAEVV